MQRCDIPIESAAEAVTKHCVTFLFRAAWIISVTAPGEDEGSNKLSIPVEEAEAEPFN